MANRSKFDDLIFYDLIATTILSVIAFGTVEPWSIALFELNALLVFVMLSIRFALQRGFTLRNFRLSLPLVGLLLMGIFQIIPFGTIEFSGPPENLAINQLNTGTVSLDPYATREAIILLFALTIYMIAALQVMKDLKRRRIVLITFAVFGFLVSVFAVIQKLTYTGKMYWIRTITPYAAPYGPYANYNHFAGLIELILPPVLAYVFLAGIDHERRLIWAISSVMMFVAAILSFSRSGITVLIAQIILMLVLIRMSGAEWALPARSKAGKIGIVTVISAVVIAMAFWIGDEALINRIETLQQVTTEYSVSTRFEYWKATFQMFLDHPVAGVGLGAFPAVYPAYGTSSAKYERLEQTHNDYLQLLTDTGLIGAALGIWFLVELVLIAKRSLINFEMQHNADRIWIIGGLVSVAGLLLHSFVDFNLQIPANALLFLFISAIISSIQSEKKI